MQIGDVISRLELKYYVNGDITEDIVVEFNMHQTVYIVKKKWRKIHIVRDEISGVVFTNIISYKTYGKNNFLGGEYCYNVFDNKEDAYKYAESLDRRRNIKLKSAW